jgi:hypothetical protein
MAPRRKISVPLVSLWSLVGSALVLLIAAAVYVAFLVRATAGISTAYPLRHPITAAELPSVFGTVTALQGTDLSLETKQPFPTLATDNLTHFASLGGQVLSLSDLHVGAVITATGKDLGGGRLAADAVVVIKDGNGTAPTPVVTAPVPAPAPAARQLTKPFTLARKDGSRSSVITPSKTSTWWVSPDGKTLLDVEIKATGSTTTTYDLATRTIKE